MLRFFALPFLAVLSVLALAVACSDGLQDNPAPSSPPREVKKLTFLAGFKPQANLPFVGAYVAQERASSRSRPSPSRSATPNPAPSSSCSAARSR